MTASLVDAAAYNSRYAIPVNDIGATGAVTLTFAFPFNTGITPATFTYQIFAADGMTSVHGPVSLTVNYAAAVTDSTWNVVDLAVAYVLEVVRTTTLNELTIVKISAVDSAGNPFSNALTPVAPEVDVLRTTLVRLIYLK